MNVIRSIAAVDHAAAGVAHRGDARPPRRTCCMITPPCTLPAVFESAMPIQRVSTDCEADGGRGSTRRLVYGARYRISSLKEARHARPGRSHVHGDQGEDLEAARPRRGPGRDARLRLPEAARAAPEREEGHRRRGHLEEAAADAVREARAAGGQARHAGAPGALAGPRGPRPRRARAQDRRPDRAPVARHAGARSSSTSRSSSPRTRRSCARRSRPSGPRRRSSRRSTPPPRPR